MKPIHFLLVFCAVLSAQAQEVCDTFSQLKEGTFLEYTNYDKKDKATSKVSHTTSNITQEGGVYTAEVKMKSQDLKNANNTFSSDYTISCQDGVIAIDMMRFFDSQSMASFGDNMDAEVDGNALTFPANANVGDQLDDGYITVSLKSGGVAIMTMTMDITNRRIETEEPVTTPAGTFDCKKIVYDFESKTGFVKVKGTVEQWYTKDQIMVLSRTKNKKGKDLGDTKLTKLDI